MFCKYCGSSVAQGAYFCAACGKDLTAPAPPVPFDPGVPPQTSGKALGSLIFGLFLFFFPFSIVAIVLGHLSLSQIRKSAGRLKGEGMAIAGLVLGYAGVICIPVILIIAAIAIPNLLRARMAANEASALHAVQELLGAETAYAHAHPAEGYSCDLAAVVRDGGASPALSAGHRNGYVLLLQNCVAEKPGDPAARFQVLAFPERANQTGRRTFCSDETGALHAIEDGSPNSCLESGTTM